MSSPSNNMQVEEEEEAYWPYVTEDLPTNLTSISDTEGSYIVNDWLPQADADSLLSAIQAIPITQPQLVSHTRLVFGHTRTSGEENHAPSANIVEMEPTPMPRQQLPPLIQWNSPSGRVHHDTAAAHLCAVVQNIEAQIACVAETLNLNMVVEADEPREMLFNHALVRMMPARHSYVGVQRLTDLPLIAGTAICMLALGEPFVLRLRNRHIMDPDEYTDHLLTPGTLVMFGPQTLAEEWLFSVPQSHMENMVSHALVELRAVERHRPIQKVFSPAANPPA